MQPLLMNSLMVMLLLWLVSLALPAQDAPKPKPSNDSALVKIPPGEF